MDVSHSHRLSRLVAPSSVAVVGATDRLGTFTGATVHNLRRYGFRGPIRPVNPRRSEVSGLPCFESISDLPGSTDCAIITVAADRVIGVLEDCVAAGIDSAIVAASGFGEGGAGPLGVVRRTALNDFLDRHPMALLGPSTTGLINLADAFVPRAATNMLPPESVHAGPIAVISQSGAANNAVFNRAQDHGVGIGLSIATGLQATVSIWDAMDYAVTDGRYSVVALLAEELGNIDRWQPAIAAARSNGCSVVVCKLGRSERGAAAVATHSGSIAGRWRAQEQALRDAGALIADDLDQLWELSSLCEAWGPPSESVGLGVVSTSGGEGALVTDLADASGIDMPDVSEEFKEYVKERLTLTQGANPFDPSGEILSRPELLEPILSSFFAQPEFNRVLVAWHVLDENVLQGIWADLQSLFERHRTTVVLSGWPLSGLPGWRKLTGTNGPPMIPGSHRAVAAIARYSEGARQPTSVPAAHTNSRQRRFDLGATYFEARLVFKDLGVPFGSHRRVDTELEAVEAITELGLPVVLKADVDSTVHKSAAGLVATGLRSEEQVRLAYRILRESAPYAPVVIEEHLLGDLQVFIGLQVDPEVGPVLLFGPGGVAVEILGGTSFGPARSGAIEALLSASPFGQFLSDRAPKALADLRLAALALIALTDDDRVASAELNPMIVNLTSGTALAADARIRLTESNHSS